MKILDCTLRDGGYYTNWDFDDKLVNDYLKLIRFLPIDTIEIGYRGNSNKKSYYGEFYFLTKSKLKKIRSTIGNKKKISIMIDIKDWNNPTDLYKNLSECKKLVDIVRFAINPKKINNLKNYLKVTKELGFKVAINLMYSHTILKNKKPLKQIFELTKYFNILYIVDSYGTLIPGDVKNIINTIKSINKKVLIGFHSHNNLELALSNSLEALENDIDYLDSTFTGIGRGAGNLRTELLLTYLSLKKNIMKIKNFKNIGKIIDQFEEMKLKEKWGTSLPYMISGSTQSPQSQTMQLIKSKRYNMSDIISYLEKKEEKKIKINKNLNLRKQNILIIGGGDSVSKKINYIKEFLIKNKDTFVIFSSSRNVNLFKKIKNKSIICITGNEISKFTTLYIKKNNFLINDFIDHKTILPKETKNFYKLKKNYLEKNINNSPLAISLAASKEMKAKKVFLLGFDGFEKINKINNYSLFSENQKILNFYRNKLNMIFLSDTIYENVNKSSIYKFLT
ncbi:MAG: hypothetical protein CL712_00350 [Chloroflexi bacterium]|nr:hypothetical protein [Chloroflexota bacterium]